MNPFGGSLNHTTPGPDFLHWNQAAHFNMQQLLVENDTKRKHIQLMSQKIHDIQADNSNMKAQLRLSKTEAKFLRENNEAIEAKILEQEIVTKIKEEVTITYHIISCLYLIYATKVYLKFSKVKSVVHLFK